MSEKIYSVNMLIALFTDFKEDGFRTLSESEVQEALQSLCAAQQSVQRTGGTGMTDGDAFDKTGMGETTARR